MQNKVNFAYIFPLFFLILLIFIHFNLHYLVFHSVVEYFTVFVSLGISFVTYYTFYFTKNRYLLFIGLGYFWVSIIDILHIQTYAGMPLFNIIDANTTTNFWVFARALEVFILFIAPFMRYKKFHIASPTAFFALFTVLSIYIAMFHPLALFDQKEGLTFLKKMMEYTLVTVLFITLYINRLHASEFNKGVRIAVQLSIVLTILAELSFTLYSDAYGIMNFTGHLFKFLSFWILLQAIMIKSISEPFTIMQQSSNTYDAIPFPAILVDKEGIIRQVNAAAIEDAELPETSIVGHNNHILFHPLNIAEDKCPVCRGIKNAEELDRFELRDTITDSVTEYSLSAIKSGEDNFEGMVQVSVDITKSKELEDSLTNQYNLIQNIIDTVPIRIFWKDKSGVYLGANELFVQDAQLESQDELIGKTDFDLTWGKTEAQLYRDDDFAVMGSKTPKLQFEETQTTDEGETITLSTSKVPLSDASGNIIGILGTYEDITKRKRIEQELERQKEVLMYQAHYDTLTELPNRILLQDRLLHAIEKAKRYNKAFAVLLVDLDQFKQINDTLGHKIGDEVLKIVAQRLKSSIRQEDTLSRLGGDEFIIVLEDIHSIDAVSRLAQKLMDNTKEPISVDSHTLYSSVSIGISLYPKDSTNSQDLIKYADSAMYKAKEEGRNNYQFYSWELTKRTMDKVRMQNNLRNAIENEELIVYYQPQIRIEDNKEHFIGVEALVRWQDPRLGIISPAEFIPLAEETGMIVELDRFVMKTAVTQVIEWYKAGFNPGTLSLNLAIKQLQQDDFIYFVKELTEQCNCVDYSRLSFEITESDIMTNTHTNIEKLNILRDLGIKISIDDFGTGYSSLSYLKNLPVSKLKIDKSFINDIPQDKDDVAIVKAIISLAKNLNLDIIAEGVETQEQKEFVEQNGCFEIQGYFYSKPLPKDEIEKFMIEFNK